MRPQYIKDTPGKTLVVLSAKEFERMAEALENMDDVRRYDEAKKLKQVFTDAETVFERIEAKRNKKQ